MNQTFRAQELIRNRLPLHEVEREGVRQAGSAVINLFQNETYLKHISLTQPLKRD
jgi:hypothetical protein